MLITLSLPLAHAGVGMPGTITVADLAKETLAKKTLKRAQASAAAAADEADQLRRIANSMFSPDSHRRQTDGLERRSQPDGPGDKQPAGAARVAGAVGTARP